MVKKNWNNPDIMKLGLETTKNDMTLEQSVVTELDEKGKWGTRCILCNGTGTNIYNIRHLELCRFSDMGSQGTDQTLPPFTES